MGKLQAGVRFVHVITLLSCVLTNQQQVAGQAQSNVVDDGPLYEGPGVLPSQILRARGFRVEDHDVITEDGYTIRLTRARNPLIMHGDSGLANRLPIIFAHGIFESFNVFVINSFGARPKDFSSTNLANMSLEAARDLLEKEPSARSLPLLALNYGHEVWIISRRGFPGSQTQAGNPVRGKNGELGKMPVYGPVSAFAGGISDYGLVLEQIKFSVDQQFWNFSLDEQARYDMPAVVDHVLNVTGRPQVSLVAHSASGAIALMALSENPELNRKINNAIFWAEAYSLGRGDLNDVLILAKPLLEKYIGSFPPAFSTDQIEAVLTLFCAARLAQPTLCESIGDLILGPSGGQEPLGPQFLNSLLYPSASHSLAQLLQDVAMGGHMHKYDYGLIGNMAAYGQAVPPVYDLGRVTLDRMSFYAGSTDAIVTLADVKASRGQLRVPSKLHVVPPPFNHLGYFFHDKNAELVIIPSLHEIHQFSQ